MFSHLPSVDKRYWDWLQVSSHAPRLLEVFRSLLKEAVVFYGRSNPSPYRSYQSQSTFTIPTIEEILAIANNQALLSNSNVFSKVNDALSTISGYSVSARWGVQSLAEELHHFQMNFNDIASAMSLLSEEHSHIKRKWNRLMKKIQKQIITKDTTIKILDRWKLKYTDQFKRFLEILTKKPIDLSLKSHQTNITFHKETDLGTPISIETISGGVLDLFIVLFLIYNNENASTIILDEPGASLHPPKRAQLREFLFHSSRNIAVITHAPELVSLNVIPFTYYCLNLEDNTQANRINDLGLDEKDINMLLEPATRSLLFANKVLFVEGNTEEVLIQALYQLYETHNEVDKQEASSITSYTLFRLEGANKFPIIHKCASLLGIQHIAILDNDTLHPVHSPNKPSKFTDELNVSTGCIRFIST
jgi:predicted ATP-dependent endonuclease of OLD family